MSLGHTSRSDAGNRCRFFLKRVDMTDTWTVAAYYRFAQIDDPAALVEHLRAFGEPLALRGTLLVAPEGINGTMAAPSSDDALDRWIERLRAIPGCADLEVKSSHSDDQPFGRFKVRLKREIVTMGQGDLNPAANAGEHLEPEAWNALIADPDTVVIDTRNDYEVAIGSFEGAIDPTTESFRDFPSWFDEHSNEWRGRKIAMFCTGGIRCEKSTAYVRAKGFDAVYHLKGGILNYLEKMPESASRWQGDCFVFDERVALGHGLTQTGRSLCKACGRPVDICICD